LQEQEETWQPYSLLTCHSASAGWSLEWPIAEHGSIIFRDSPVGRQAYVLGRRVAVWQVVSIVRAYGGDVEAAARHLEWPIARVQAALAYAAAYPDEIEAAIEDNARYNLGTVSQMLPQARQFTGE
jgi:uncharacterized protein (DUF433 family)